MTDGDIDITPYTSNVRSLAFGEPGVVWAEIDLNTTSIKINSVAGISGTVANPTSITIANGIVTACS
jgi:hypothetical protein